MPVSNIKNYVDNLESINSRIKAIHHNQINLSEKHLLQYTYNSIASITEDITTILASVSTLVSNLSAVTNSLATTNSTVNTLSTNVSTLATNINTELGVIDSQIVGIDSQIVGIDSQIVGINSNISIIDAALATIVDNIVIDPLSLTLNNNVIFPSEYIFQLGSFTDLHYEVDHMQSQILALEISDAISTIVEAAQIAQGIFNKLGFPTIPGGYLPTDEIPYSVEFQPDLDMLDFSGGISTGSYSELGTNYFIALV